MNAYLWLKTLHLLGVVVFLGNIVVTAWWKIAAARTRDPKVIAFAQRQVTLTDWVFTGPGAAAVLGAGLAMIRALGLDLWSVPWLLWGLALFGGSGILWAAVLIPVQVRQARLARDFADGSEIPEEYWRLERVWQVVGTVAVLLPLGNLYVMVSRLAG